MTRTPALFLLIALLAACTAKKAEKPTVEELTQEVTEVFESPVVYAIRTMDSTEVLAFISSHPEVRGDSVGIMDFYRRRRFQYAWIVQDSVSQSALGFLSFTNSADTVFGEVAALRNQLFQLLEGTQAEGRGVALCDTCQRQLELNLTAQFFRFADKKYGGLIGKDLRELDWFIPRRKKDYARLLDSLTAGTMDLSLIEPLHPQYTKLKSHLKRFHEMDTLMDWAPLSLGKLRKLEPGDNAEVVIGIRQRLMILGDLEGVVDSTRLSSTRYDSTLVRATQLFQVRHGLHADGVIGSGTIAAMNIGPRERLRTLLVNMERLRWVPENVAPDLILVNIPEFRMHVFEDGEEALGIDVVVGNTATRTVIFSDTLSTIVFSPYWNVPYSIVRNEILPAMKKDPNYLAKKGMERTGGSDALPRIRQKPGASNALGRVKFLFPNTYSIYFHDTPSKGGFAKEQRAFSHGCIRLSQPKELAEYLLRNDTVWTPEKIKEAMYGGKETHVRLAHKRPVTIGYFTAWVDAEGRLNFRNDVYGHDQRLASELFFDPIAPVTMEPITASSLLEQETQ